MDLQTLLADKGLEKKGVLVPYEDGTLKFRIAAHGNPKHKARMASLGQQYPAHKIKTSPELVDTITMEAMVDAVFLGWEGEITLGGKVLDPAKREDRLKVLESSVLREWIAAQATDLRNFQTEGGTDTDADDLKSGA